MKQKLRNVEGQLEEFDTQLSKNLNQLLTQLISEQKIHGLKLGVYMPLKYEPDWIKEFDSSSIKEFLLVHMHEEIKLTYHQVNFECLKNKIHTIKIMNDFIYSKSR